ncbi:MAG: DUF1615 family protein [Myxococcaceae bacterium]
MRKIPLVLLLLAGCASSRGALNASPPLTVEQITALVPERVKDRALWAADVASALEAVKRPAEVINVCSVLAIIEQESGFNPNPSVPNLSRIVKAKLEQQAAKLGPFGGPLLKKFLSGRAPGESLTFDKRIERVKTEQDLDRVFRDLLAFQRSEHPAAFTAVDLGSALFGKGRLSEMNPITTAGSMQVSVRFSRERAEEEGRKYSDEELREELYTRTGGVHYGTARLMAHFAAYDAPLYRFADYNAGVYASRNAALQKTVSELTGLPLVLDGDFLAYDAEGEVKDGPTRSMEALEKFRQRYAPKISAWRLERDARAEKELDFEDTDTVRSIRQAYSEKFGRTPAYAIVPEVTLHSPKMRSDRTTAWFARSVQTRFERCLSAARNTAQRSGIVSYAELRNVSGR